MGIRESYENGVFSWVDLATTNQDAAKNFYGKLFGWEFVDKPMPHGGVYSMAQKNGRDVTAIFTMEAEKTSQNIPPHWQSYINTVNLDATIAAWQNHGGSLIMPAFDVMESGTMAIAQDPTDAIVYLWQPKAHFGAGVVNEINTFSWAELQTWDAEQATKFYQNVFGWDIDIDEKPPNYIMASVKGLANCGIFDMGKTQLPREIPAKWAVYFNVENLDASMDLVKELGGKVLMPPMAVDVGRFTTIMDPQGAMVTLIELLQVDD